MKNREKILYLLDMQHEINCINHVKVTSSFSRVVKLNEIQEKAVRKKAVMSGYLLSRDDQAATGKPGSQLENDHSLWTQSDTQILMTRDMIRWPESSLGGNSDLPADLQVLGTA